MLSDMLSWPIHDETVVGLYRGLDVSLHSQQNENPEISGRALVNAKMYQLFQLPKDMRRMEDLRAEEQYLTQRMIELDEQEKRLNHHQANRFAHVEAEQALAIAIKREQQEEQQKQHKTDVHVSVPVPVPMAIPVPVPALVTTTTTMMELSKALVAVNENWNPFQQQKKEKEQEQPQEQAPRFQQQQQQEKEKQEQEQDQPPLFPPQREEQAQQKEHQKEDDERRPAAAAAVIPEIVAGISSPMRLAPIHEHKEKDESKAKPILRLTLPPHKPRQEFNARILPQRALSVSVISEERESEIARKIRSEMRCEPLRRINNKRR